MHLHINVHCKAPTRGCLRDALDEKGFTCTGWAITDPYIRINQEIFSYHSFREVKGQKFIYFDKQHLAPLRLVPKEAVTTFMVSVAR